MRVRLSERPLAHGGHSSLIQPQRPIGGDGPSRIVPVLCSVRTVIRAERSSITG